MSLIKVSCKDIKVNKKMLPKKVVIPHWDKWAFLGWNNWLGLSFWDFMEDYYNDVTPILQRLPEKIREKDEKLKEEMMGKKNIRFVMVLFSIMVYLFIFPINKAVWIKNVKAYFLTSFITSVL